MANPRRSITVVPQVSFSEAEAGPPLPAYRIHLDQRGLYRWAPGDASTADGIKVIAASGGVAGNFIRVDAATRGDNLTNADATVQVGGNAWRALPSSVPLTANRTLTLGTTNATAGDEITITRLDTGAFTMAIVNGGSGAGTLITLPVSVRSFADFQFDGTDWALMRAGQMPA